MSCCCYKEWGVEVKQILISEREGRKRPDGKVPVELVSLYLRRVWRIQSRKRWVVLLEMDPSPASAVSVCLHQICCLFLVFWHNKNRQQSQGHFAVPRVLLPRRAIYLSHDESEIKFKTQQNCNQDKLLQLYQHCCTQHLHYKFDAKKNYQASVNIRNASIRNHIEASPTRQTKIASGYKSVFFLKHCPVVAQMSIAVPLNSSY